MSAYMEKTAFKTDGNGIVDITNTVQDIVRRSGITDGFCIIHSVHTTAGLFVTANGDVRTLQDVNNQIGRIVPMRNDFLNQYNTPAAEAGHVKTAVVGTTLTLIVADGKILLGTSQGIMFDDFDGPRSRQVIVKVISD